MMQQPRRDALKRWSRSGPYNTGAVSAAVDEFLDEIERLERLCESSITAKNIAVALYDYLVWNTNLNGLPGPPDGMAAIIDSWRTK